MKLLKQQPLAHYTSLNVGGNAELLILPDSYDECFSLLLDHPESIVLGYGCNVVISDAGLPGTTIMMRRGEIKIENTVVIADAGVWWDDLVKSCIEYNLWGMELASGIPSSVGGAISGNIAAYGHQVSDTLSWVEVLDRHSKKIYRIPASDIQMEYRSSMFQDMPNLVILRAGFELSRERKQVLAYDSALAIGDELGLDYNSLPSVREIILETRRRAGSIYSFDTPNVDHSAGSFFKNPLVSTEQATELAKFDETGKTLERIENQNQIHGGDSHRASAAHVLLASGFKRGQSWDHVQLHDRHVLKIVTHPGATASEVYDVAQEIISTARSKTGIALEPEPKFIGEF